MKPLYRTVKVIYDGRCGLYEVYYRNWFKWHYHTGHVSKASAIECAEGMLKTAEVWRQSQVYY